ncbi:unnamed protein product [Amoebophrya sp. A120]|nr:unnamed protein product [Amoebophrya sp. A120]|eukprot:GSA120T00014611001.1
MATARTTRTSQKIMSFFSQGQRARSFCLLFVLLQAWWWWFLLLPSVRADVEAVGATASSSSSSVGRGTAVANEDDGPASAAASGPPGVDVETKSATRRSDVDDIKSKPEAQAQTADVAGATENQDDNDDLEGPLPDRPEPWNDRETWYQNEDKLDLEEEQQAFNEDNAINDIVDDEDDVSAANLDHDQQQSRQPERATQHTPAGKKIEDEGQEAQKHQIDGQSSLLEVQEKINKQRLSRAGEADNSEVGAGDDGTSSTRKNMKPRPKKGHLDKIFSDTIDEISEQLPKDEFELEKRESALMDLVSLKSDLDRDVVKKTSLVEQDAQNLDNDLHNLKEKQEKELVLSLLHGGMDSGPVGRNSGSGTGETGSAGGGTGSGSGSGSASGSTFVQLTKEDIENWRHRYGHFVYRTLSAADQANAPQNDLEQRVFRLCEHMEIRPQEFDKQKTANFYAKTVAPAGSGRQNQQKSSSYIQEKEKAGQMGANAFGEDEEEKKLNSSPLVDIWCNFKDAELLDADRAADPEARRPEIVPIPAASLDGTRLLHPQDALKDVKELRWDGKKRLYTMVSKHGKPIAKFEKVHIPYGLWKMDFSQLAPIDQISNYIENRGYDLRMLMPAVYEKTGRTDSTVYQYMVTEAREAEDDMNNPYPNMVTALAKLQKECEYVLIRPMQQQHADLETASEEEEKSVPIYAGSTSGPPASGSSRAVGNAALDAAFSQDVAYCLQSELFRKRTRILNFSQNKRAGVVLADVSVDDIGADAGEGKTFKFDPKLPMAFVLAPLRAIPDGYEPTWVSRDAPSTKLYPSDIGSEKRERIDEDAHRLKTIFALRPTTSLVEETKRAWDESNGEGSATGGLKHKVTSFNKELHGAVEDKQVAQHGTFSSDYYTPEVDRLSHPGAATLQSCVLLFDADLDRLFPRCDMYHLRDQMLRRLQNPFSSASSSAASAASTAAAAAAASAASSATELVDKKTAKSREEDNHEDDHTARATRASPTANQEKKPNELAPNEGVDHASSALQEKEKVRINDIHWVGFRFHRWSRSIGLGNYESEKIEVDLGLMEQTCHANL